MSTDATVGLASGRAVCAYIIGDPSVATQWLPHRGWTVTPAQTPRSGIVVLVAPSGCPVPPAHVAQARRLARQGLPVYVLTGTARAPVTTPWRLVGWIRDSPATPRAGSRAAPDPDTEQVGLRGLSRPPGQGQPAAGGSQPLLSPSTGAGLTPAELPHRQTRGGTPRRRRAVGRLASKGPATASYVQTYWAAHGTAPRWADIGLALGWPGDTADHQRALEAFTKTEWITATGQPPTARPGRRWIDQHPDRQQAQRPDFRKRQLRRDAQT